MMLRGVVVAGVAVLLAGAASEAVATPPLEAYGRLPAIEDVALSPSGARLALITVVDDQRLVVAQTLEGQLLQRIQVGPVKVRDVAWADDDHVLIKMSDRYDLLADSRYAREGETVAVVNLKTHQLHPVFWKSPQILPLIYGDFGTAVLGGRAYGYFAAVTYGRDQLGTRLGTVKRIAGPADLYRVDLDTGVGTIVSRGSNQWCDWVVDRSGTVIARSVVDPDSGNWRLYAGDGDRLVAQGPSVFEPHILDGVGRSAGTVVLTTTTPSGGSLTRELNLADGSASGPLGGGGGDIASLRHDPVSHRLVAAEFEGDTLAVRAYDPVLAASLGKARRAFAGHAIKLTSFSADFKRLVIEVEGNRNSGIYYLVDIGSGEASIVGERYPGIDPGDVGPSSIVHYTAGDGLSLQGVLTLPPGTPPPGRGLPLVVLPHGGPEARDHLGFDWWAQAFASRGYAVFQPNYRGSGGFGLAFRNRGFGEWGRKMQSDISDGVQALATQGVIDPGRACIVGGSYGGYAALAGVTLQTGLYRCAVSVAGVADPGAMLEWEQARNGELSPTMRYWRAFMGAKGPSDPVLRTISPFRLAASANAPILLIHGTDDTVVPVTQSRLMERALKTAGKPVELVEMPNEDHWLSREATRITMLKAAVDFVERNNPSTDGAVSP